MTTLITIVSKPSNYKVCTSCEGINLNKNEKCVHCGDTKKFDGSFPAVHKFLQNSYSYHEQKMTEAEADLIPVLTHNKKGKLYE